MTYSAEINRASPACLLLLVDQSYSMGEPWRGSPGSKAQALAFTVNRLLMNAVILCTKGAGTVYDYFDIGVIGYGENVAPVLPGTSASRPLIAISEVANSPLRVDKVTRKEPDGAGGVVQVDRPMPIWVDPHFSGGTPMSAAFASATSVLERWCGEHPNSFPPIVINVTDGEPTDGDPRAAATGLRATGVRDGKSLLFNLHLSSNDASQVLLPNSMPSIGDNNAETLFDASSELPVELADGAKALGFAIQSGARGFMYNASAEHIIEFLNLGTRAVTPTGLRELER